MPAREMCASGASSELSLPGVCVNGEGEGEGVDTYDFCCFLCFFCLFCV